MAIEKGGRSIRGIRYDSAEAGRVIILKAYYDDPRLGRVVVWDGRISENVYSPAVPFSVALPAPVVHADATVEGADISYWLSPPSVEVSAGSSPEGAPVEYTLAVDAPSGLSGSHIVDAAVIEYGVELEGGAIASSIGGEFADPMRYTVATPEPEVSADATVAAGPMVFYVEPAAPSGAGAFADVEAGVIEYAAQVPSPSVVSASSVVEGAAVSVAVAAVAPAVSGSSSPSGGGPVEYAVDMPAPDARAFVPEEIMFTVTSLVPVPSTANTTAAITNLSWLPSGATTSTVDLAAGEWVMLVWAVPSGSYPYYRQFGIRRGGTDTWGPSGGSTTGSDFNSFLRFTLTAATTVTIIGRATRNDIPHLIKPGDVFAFAPVIS